MNPSEKSWQARIGEATDAIAQKFVESTSYDQRMYKQDIAGSIAHAKMLAKVNLISQAEASAIVDGLKTIERDIESGNFKFDEGLEDIHMVIEAALIERVGEPGKKLHTGRSRNDQVSLDLRLWLREEIDRSVKELLGLMSALLDMAKRDPQAIVVGYTHTRRAQPVLWPHYLLAYFEMFARDLERLKETRSRVDVMPLGSGAMAGSGFPFDREAIAKDLGFASITKNSMDVSGDRDFALDFLHAANLTMLHLSRLAEDWILYSGEEYGWLELGDGVTSGSSIMPQKKNPDSLELIRGKCGGVFGDYSALFLTMKGLPMTYNRDMQEDKPRIFDAADQLRGSLEMARVVVETTRLNPARPAAAVEESWAVATDLADALARSGVPFHHAHKMVGRLVLESVRDGRKPSDWTAETLAAFDPAFTSDVARYLRPAEGIETRELPGGTGPKAVAKALVDAGTRLSEMAK